MRRMTEEQERIFYEIHANTVEMMTMLVHLEKRQNQHEVDDKTAHAEIEKKRAAEQAEHAARIVSLEGTRTKFGALYLLLCFLAGAAPAVWWLYGLVSRAKAQ